MKYLCYQRIIAPNDRNGNPRRCFVAYGADGEIVRVWDEGYAGRPVGLRDVLEIASVRVAPAEYRWFLEEGAACCGD